MIIIIEKYFTISLFYYKGLKAVSICSTSGLSETLILSIRRFKLASHLKYGLKNNHSLHLRLIRSDPQSSGRGVLSMSCLS